MIASPAVFLGGLVVLAILRWLWKPLIGPTQTAPKLQGVTFGVLVALSLIGYFAIPGASEWAGIALWLFGTSYGSVLLLVWRIWLHKKPETSFSRAPVATIIGLLTPVPILVFAPLSDDAVGGITTGLWMLPGGLGYATFPLFMMAVFEAIGRRMFPKESPAQDSKPTTSA